MTHGHRRLGTALALTSCLVLGACASTKDDVIPTDGPTMLEIYEDHHRRMRGDDVVGARSALGAPVSDGARDLHGYTRDAHNELDVVFPRLPNPTLMLYVFPHLAGPDGTPVPGYATRFSMYEREHYALPGEVR